MEKLEHFKDENRDIKNAHYELSFIKIKIREIAFSSVQLGRRTLIFIQSWDLPLMIVAQRADFNVISTGFFNEILSVFQ